jgi:glutathione S-transferase
MYTLIIGNKNYSSWSLRPWLILKAFGIPFQEEAYQFDTPRFAEVIGAKKRSPSGRVPVLHDHTTAAWDSLSIAEYLAERHAGLWPSDAQARAHARSACAEMHSSFQQLRGRMPMCVRRHYPVTPEPAVQNDIDRIAELWQQARSQFGATGPYLYGQFSIADAFFAPVVFRFATYGVVLDSALMNYCQNMRQHPAMQEWARDAASETQVVGHEEPEHIYGVH